MKLAEDLYSALVGSHMLLSESDDRFFEQYRLGKTRYYALVHIHEQPGISLSALSELLLCTKGNTTRIIKGLEQDGYLSREVDKEDNRAQRLALTENGQKLLDTASAAYLSYRQTLFACLSNEQKKSLIENLKVLNADCISQLRPNQSP